MHSVLRLDDLAILRTAIFGGPNDAFRYELRRVWDTSKPMLVVCMLNPSTADQFVDDPTIKTLIFFGNLWGYGGLLIVNLNAFRASQPAEMKAAPDSVGPENQDYIEGALRYAASTGGRALAAWGNDGGFGDRAEKFCLTAKSHGVELICLGRTSGGYPKHPMARGHHRIGRDQLPILYRSAA